MNALLRLLKISNSATFIFNNKHRTIVMVIIKKASYKYCGNADGKECLNSTLFGEILVEYI
jgi:hypothetical protein